MSVSFGSATKWENIAQILLWLLCQPGENTVMAAVSDRREVVWSYVMLCLLLWLLWEPEEKSEVPMGPCVFFHPLSLHFAYPGFREQCRECDQQDKWHCEQDEEQYPPHPHIPASLHRSQPCHGKGTHLNEVISHAWQGKPRWMDHSEELWQNVVTWRRTWKPLQYTCLENHMDSMKRQKDMTLEDELQSQKESLQYATGEEQRTITNSSRKNEEAGPKQKWCSVVDVSGSESKVQCCKDGILGLCIKATGPGQAGDGKIEHSYLKESVK